MRKIVILTAIVIGFAGCTPKSQTAKNQPKNIDTIATINRGNVDFKTYFTDKTMRLDYYHTGNAKREHFAIDQVVNDGLWSGSQTQLIDKLELGSYFFEVVDKASNVLLYSRGFASIFGEWQSTPEADSLWGTFSESLRFPWPLKSVIVKLKKRDRKNKFETIWITTVDPASRQVNPAEIKHTEKVDIIANNGPASTKLDIVILGDGYTEAEMGKFRSDAKRLSAALLGVEPYKSRVKDINIRAVETPAEESGVTKLHHGIFRRSPLSTHYSSFDSERYLLSYDNKTIRNVASAVPYDFTVILVNERTYGGGGIYNLYTTVAADNRFSSYIMIHELGHHLAGLADEYYSSAVAYEAPNITVEPWEPNITALLDKNNLKWKDLVTADTPIPTPWNKEAFDKYEYQVQKTRDSLRAAHVDESVMENLFLNQKAMETELFNKEKYKDAVGAFEGAGYSAKGLYRPQVDCIMYTRHEKFCKVCQRSISNVIDEYSR
ncbi:MAG TPA: IgA Peptidase M64 [Williamwhitmania sp.]|nr:IgA Peptidase M64 [Williamwhitmania sp.]